MNYLDPKYAIQYLLASNNKQVVSAYPIDILKSNACKSYYTYTHEQPASCKPPKM